MPSSEDAERSQPSDARQTQEPVRVWPYTRPAGGCRVQCSECGASKASYYGRDIYRALESHRNKHRKRGQEVA